MRKHEARKIAEKITNKQIAAMFSAAKEGIKDWTKVSRVNKGMTKGAAWNILAAKFDQSHNYHIMAKTNMVMEFGDFLPNDLRQKIVRRTKLTPVHQNPNFQ